MPEATTDEEAAPRPFAALLHEYRRGELHDELSEHMQVLVAAVVEHGKKGTITLKVEVAPAGKGAGNQLIVSGSVDVKPPKPDASAQFFFADERMNLSRNDPNQTRLDIDPAGARRDTA